MLIPTHILEKSGSLKGDEALAYLRSKALAMSFRAVSRDVVLTYAQRCVFPESNVTTTSNLPDMSFLTKRAALRYASMIVYKDSCRLGRFSSHLRQQFTVPLASAYNESRRLDFPSSHLRHPFAILVTSDILNCC